MATFTWVPDFASQESSEPQSAVMQYGDGYEHRLRFGLNTNPRAVNLQFTGVGNAERDAILGFLEARRGVENFDWADLRGRTGRKWICPSWSYSPTGCNIGEIFATFEEVFEPAY